MRYTTDSYIKKKLRKIPNKAKLSGVCAGVARYYEWPLLAVRLVSLVVFIIFPFAVALGYLLAAFLLESE